MKCDVIIPIYNSLNWVKMCIYSLMQNTNQTIINNVILINDKSNKETTNYLRMIEKKYNNIVLIENKRNLGFLKSCNLAMSISTADFLLLLNSDCLVSKNAIEKLINAMKKDKKIGLMCPISSKAANLSFPLPEGYNYQMLNELFEKNFKGKTFDACTVVGNCLMISRKCIEEVGYFDEIFGKGYTEETDYQFKAEQHGFKAKVLIDTYVFHECRVSFGESKKQLEIRDSHLKLFFERWGKEYNQKMAKYRKNDPIEYIKKHISYEILDKKCKVLDNLDDKTIEYINCLIMTGYSDMVIKTNKDSDLNKNMLFNPLLK